MISKVLMECAPPSSPSFKKISFAGNKLILAPMVRANRYAFRQLCLNYGADIVYGEELIDKAMLTCNRVYDEDLEMTKLIYPSGRELFTTKAGHGPCIFQMGTNNAANALRAAQMIIDHVDGIDINMGCPKKFSVKGGMGVALMENPERVQDILTTLRKNLPESKTVTCKIRVFAEKQKTLDFVRMVEKCGIDAIGIHGRTKDQRPKDDADWDIIKCCKEVLSIPVILNGDVWTHQDALDAMSKTGADSVMIARGALLNPAIFSPTAVPRMKMMQDFLHQCDMYANHPKNTKWTLMRFMQGGDKKEKQMVGQVQQCQEMRDFYEKLGIEPLRGHPSKSKKVKVQHDE